MANLSNYCIKFILLLLILSLYSSSCSDINNDIHNYVLVDDILSKFEILDKTHDTQNINFRNSSSRKYLLSGWSFTEENHTWAIGKSSTVNFYSVENFGNKVVSISCAPLITPKYDQQKITIFLNNSELKTIILKNSWGKYNIVLPKRTLKPGENQMRFDYAYCARPESGLDSRYLAVRFKRIAFNQESKSRHYFLYNRTSKAIVQFPISFFTYSTITHSKNKIIIDYEISGKIQALLKFTLPDNLVKKTYLPVRKKHVEYLIPFAKNTPIRIDFIVASGPIHGNIEWKHIGIYANAKDIDQPNNKSPFLNEGFVKEKKPDIIIYVIDALRSDHLSCYGYRRNTTPNIDKFSKENTFFKNAFANSSWTRASAATILTGLLAKRHKTMKRESRLPDDLITLPEKLREKGYYTAAFITNSNISEVFGFDQGFDDFNSFQDSTKSDELNQYVLKFIDRHTENKNKKPLFLLIWSMDPHCPYTPHQSVKNYFNIEKYETVENKDRNCKFIHKVRTEGEKWPSESQNQYLMTLYDQEILFNDMSFGEFLDKLKGNGLYDDSIIILTADHGEEFRDHGWYLHGITLYDEVIKIPFILKAPKIKRGIFDEKIQLADIYPTLLDLLNIPLSYEVDGDSFLGAKDFTHRPICAEEILDGHNLRSIIYQNKKFIHNIYCPYKYLNKKRNDNVFELYNLDEDSKEQVNINKNTEIINLYLSQNLKYVLHGTNKSLNVQDERVNISPELDQKLRQLGYGK